MKTTSTGKNVCSFSVAVNSSFKKDEVTFLNIVAWNKDADYVVNYLGKGRLVAIEGRIQTRKYTASDGGNREIVEIVAESVQGLDRPANATDARAARGTTAVIAPQPDEYDPFAED